MVRRGETQRIALVIALGAMLASGFASVGTPAVSAAVGDIGWAAVRRGTLIDFQRA